ncbi:MAG: hypothetical protein ACRDBG_00575, partial [Waterburya sp.]
QLQAANTTLKANRNLTEVVRDFIRANLAFEPPKIHTTQFKTTKNKPVRGNYSHLQSGDWVSRWNKWINYKEIKHRYFGLDLTQIKTSEVLMEMDLQFKTDPRDKNERMFISNTNGWGDIENAKLKKIFDAKSDCHALFCTQNVGESNPWD